MLHCTNAFDLIRLSYIFLCLHLSFLSGGQHGNVQPFSDEDVSIETLSHCSSFSDTASVADEGRFVCISGYTVVCIICASVFSPFPTGQIKTTSIWLLSLVGNKGLIGSDRNMDVAIRLRPSSARTSFQISRHRV